MPGPPATSRFAKYAIVAILIFGAWLRFSGIGGGLPYLINVDEPQIMNRALDMVKNGNFSPSPFYDYPTLSTYLSAAVIGVRFLDGAQHHEWRTLKDVWPGQFLLWCRFAIAALSVFTIYLVYRSAIRWGMAAAIVAALLVAVQPQLTSWAHYVLTDTPMTFFVALTMLVTLCALETGRWTWFLAAGAAAGLAAATKYNGAVAIVMPLGGLALAGGATIRGRSGSAAAVVLGAGIAFLVAAPYTVLDLPAFLNGFGSLLSQYPIQSEPKYWMYFRHILNALVPPSVRGPYGPWVWAAPALAMMAAGFVTLGTQLFVRATRASAFVLLLFPVVYFWFVSNQGGPSMTFDRYQIALWPALAIWFGVGVIVVRDMIVGPTSSSAFRRSVLGALLATLIVPAYHAYEQNAALNGTHTIQNAGDWLKQNVKPGDRVLVGAQNIQLPPKVKGDTANGLRPDALNQYRNDGYTYLVVSSEYLQRPEEVAAYRPIFDATNAVATFARPGETTYTILRMK